MSAVGGGRPMSDPRTAEPVAPEPTLRSMSRIVGIEVRLTRLDGKGKLNPHHQQRDREGAIRGLRACGDHGVAQALRVSAPVSELQADPPH